MTRETTYYGADYLWQRSGPHPSMEDYAAAERFIAETYDADPEVSREWLASNRTALVKRTADWTMQDRLRAEHAARHREAVGRQLGKAA